MSAKILIVEDESIVQLDLQQRVEGMGYTVVGVASRGEEAVTKAIELQPDLVIMDVSLEGPMNGIEAARRIRQAQGTPVVYVTAYAAALEAVGGAERRGQSGRAKRARAPQAEGSDGAGSPTSHALPFMTRYPDPS
jgi:CheY-like chemotaxis protein